MYVWREEGEEKEREGEGERELRLQSLNNYRRWWGLWGCGDVRGEEGDRRGRGSQRGGEGRGRGSKRVFGLSFVFRLNDIQ